MRIKICRRNKNRNLFFFTQPANPYLKSVSAVLIRYAHEHVVDASNVENINGEMK